TLVIDKDKGPALLMKEATFEWESYVKNSGEAFSSKGAPGSPLMGKDRSVKENMVKEKPAPGKDAPLFQVMNMTMTIPRGQLVVVGPVGSDKSSLLQGLLGEMRKVSGHVSFGGRIGCCPQTGSRMQDNITFGQPFEEDKYWCVIETACLLPDGDLTEIGEKGIDLSGGQKQSEMPSVDVDIRMSLFQDAIASVLQNHGITVILVTHAVHFLSQADYIP
ncbi:P-loop containing nucleoside triphosphate hydrolase protein, partial [Suillus subluteus]